MTTYRSGNLHRLSELDDYEVADENPDIRGWALIGPDDGKLGTVDELIVDPDLKKVRYIDVNVDDSIISTEDRHILIPIGAASLHESDNLVIVHGLDKEKVKYFPVYNGEKITRHLEYEIQDALKKGVPVPSKPVGSTSHSERVAMTEMERKKYEEEAKSEDPMVKLRAERDIARAERDIALAQLELMRIQRDNARAGIENDFYAHEYYDDDRFFESRKRKEDG